MVLLNKSYDDYADVIGRLLIGAIFAYAGIGKILSFEGTAGWIASVGLPFASLLLVLVIVLELFGGIMLVLGIKTKFVAFLLAGFTILATLIFHTSNLSDMTNQLLFTKNLMILGGLLFISSKSAGRFSLLK